MTSLGRSRDTQTIVQKLSNDESDPWEMAERRQNSLPQHPLGQVEPEHLKQAYGGYVCITSIEILWWKYIAIINNILKYIY